MAGESNQAAHIALRPALAFPGETRSVDEDCKEYGIAVRGKQRNHSNMWDDLPVSNYTE
jgi:hypothetical protein